MKLHPLYSEYKGNSYETQTMLKLRTKLFAMIKDFQNGGDKNVDISTKISSLQCSWVKN